MSATLRSYYLQTMGITEWRLRSVVTQYFYNYQLINGQQQSVGILLGDSVAVDESQIVAEQNLLHAIAKALSVMLKGERGEWSLRSDSIANSNRVIILMGNQVAQKYADLKIVSDIKVVKTVAAADMLAQPALKAETWQRLKPLIPMLQATS